MLNVDSPISVPREVGANLDFREWISKKGFESKSSAAALRGLCKQDIFFFINAFCWTSNPMWHPNCPERPFILHSFQESAIRRMLCSLSRAGRPEHLGRTDLVFLKSRGMGASWLVLFVMLYRWLFFRSQSFLVVSRNASLVDRPNDMDALMPKLDFAYDRLPTWLRPKLQTHDRVEMKFRNPETQSVINGQATTEDFARGGRPTAIMLDEFAFFKFRDSFNVLKSATGASFCCWFVSTTNGVGNAFHKIVTDGNIEQIDFCWQDMPEKRVGLYRNTCKGVEILDPSYSFPAGYPFIPDGRLRSVWYDAEERRTGLQSLMRQEHDRDFVGSGDPFFDPEDLKRLEHRICPPRSKNTYVADNGTKAELRLWLAPRASKSPPLDRCYVLGVDVSAGTGASNSCICVYDTRLGEKVGEVAEPKCDPTEIAEIAAQIGRWFEDWTGTPALIIWEANGVGRSFGKRLLGLEYENLYYATPNLDEDERKRRAPGFWATPASNQTVLRDYAVALCRGRFVEHSGEGLKECHDFKYFEGGKIKHYREVTAEDKSGARDNHGDRVRANALALRGAAGISEPFPTAKTSVDPKYPCFYNEMREAKRLRRDETRLKEGWLAG